VENLQQTNAKLEEFTRVASHDLKEPIRKVRFFTDRLQSLLKDKLNDEETNLFQRVDNAAQRMALLVDDLLAYSQLTDEASEQEDIDLNKKVKLILTDIELLVQEKGAVIETDNLPTIKANRRQMQQLFQNLITNALKYTKPNIPPRVTIRYKKIKGSEAPFTLPDAALPKDFHLIEVCDNGIGFPQSDADRIFNVFTRLHGNKEYPGTGIGLSIAKRVVENHHGFIYAKGQPGEGACFYVLLPVQ
jgi:signal transduction histidine kinase